MNHPPVPCPICPPGTTDCAHPVPVRATHGEWLTTGACVTTDPAELAALDAIFFPTEKTVTVGDPYLPARAICATCPIQARCAGYAIATGSTHGMFGGYTPAERATWSHVLPWADPLPGAPTETAPEPWHGTRYGYVRHKCRCDRCTTAERDYSRAKRLKIKAAGLPTDRATTAHTTDEEIAARRARRSRGTYRQQHVTIPTKPLEHGTWESWARICFCDLCRAYGRRHRAELKAAGLWEGMRPEYRRDYET